MGTIRSYMHTVGLGGLAHAVLAKLEHGTHRITLKRSDCRFPIRLRVPSSDVATYKQVFLDGEYCFHATRPPETIVDAGANIGMVSVYFANRYPDARIIALEPERDNFELLCENVLDYPAVIPVQAALWDHDGEIEVVDPGAGNWAFMTQEGAATGIEAARACHRARAMTVDALMAAYDLPRISILKVDIEGAEREVFRDPSAWIDRVDAMAVELHDRLKPGCSRSFYAGTAGFDCEWTHGESVFLSRGNIAREPPRLEAAG